jgi:uncharacterized protein YbaR (Trm112 family)
MSTTPPDLLACPRCDKTPLDALEAGFRCGACKVDFPYIDNIPWLFADPAASLAEWRSRLHSALQAVRHECEGLDRELASPALRESTRQRVQRYRELLDRHRLALSELLAPLGPESLATEHETYLALRTRMPSDQGLNTYYANVHRDWAWGDAENEASVEALRRVLDGATNLGTTLVLGAGAGRLVYDIKQSFEVPLLLALDFNPLLFLIAKRMFAGETLDMVEFPLAPRRPEDDAVLQTLKAPVPVGAGLHLVLGDALRPPFAGGRFDTVITPWLIDIVSEDLPTFAARMNTLLCDGGRWLNFGSLAFSSATRAGRHTVPEVAEILADAGFEAPQVDEATIPYMDSPASRHGRRETVFTFSTRKIRAVKPPPRHRALPDWIVTGKEPVPLSADFKAQAVSTRIYAFVMSLIDGKRSLNDMADLFEAQRLMPRDEAAAAIRLFLIRMYEDGQKPR